MANGNDLDAAHKFLLDEYNRMVDLGEARNERFDKLVTMFLSLAGAPWVLYALVIKDKGAFNLSEMPPLVAATFFIVGLLGFLVVIMCVQTKFLVILYTRTVNMIRGQFSDASIKNALHLPTTGDQPPYREKGSYNSYAASGMAAVNGLYVGLAFYRLLNYWFGWKWHSGLVGSHVGMILITMHYCYYVYQANQREIRGKNKLTFREPDLTALPLGKKLWRKVRRIITGA